MQVINKIEIDLLSRGIIPTTDVVQNDANSRGVEISLVVNGEQWAIPARVTAAVAFRKPDGTRGLYDMLPNGSAATTVSDASVTAIFAPEMLTVPGIVDVSVILNDESMNQLATFPFVVKVTPNPAAGCAISNNYYKLQNLDQINTAFEELQKQVDAILKVDDAAVSSSAAWSSKNTIDKLCPTFTESGSVVTCEPVEGYPLEAEWKTKNLFDISKVPITEASPQGAHIAEVTENGIKIVTTEGYTGNGYANTAKPLREFCPGLKAGDTITINGTSDSSNTYIWLSTPANKALYFGLGGYVVTEDMLNSAVVFYGFNNSNVVEGVGVCTISNIQVELGTTATAYEPYAETATITRCGKNLIPFPYEFETKTQHGITYTVGADGTITLNGTATQAQNLVFKVFTLTQETDYVLSANFENVPVGATSVGISVHTADWNSSMEVYSGSLDGIKVKSIPANMYHLSTYIASGAVCNNVKIKPQLEFGTVATAYEPYTEPETFAPGESITAIPGVNTIYADAGLVTVKGKADPGAIINKLCDKVDALTATITALTGV